VKWFFIALAALLLLYWYGVKTIDKNLAAVTSQIPSVNLQDGETDVDDDSTGEALGWFTGYVEGSNP
jgi:hypothetical protein